MKTTMLKRITAMVLIFVMCTFLITDNSIGVKAAAAGDVIVDETQITSEIGEENPSDANVEIVSELPEEEEADSSVEETVNSEETEETQPVVVLAQNGTVLSDSGDDTAEAYTLTYGSESENYTSFAEISARIDELNNASGVYTIVCTDAGSEYDYFADITGTFPTQAAELIFDSTGDGPNFAFNEYVETDIKLTFYAGASFSWGCDLKEVCMSGATLTAHKTVENKAPVIETLTLTEFGAISSGYEVQIGTCNVENGAFLGGTWYDSDTSTYHGDGHFVVDTLNITGSHLTLATEYGYYEENDVILTTKSDITLADIYNGSVNAEWVYELVDNGDGTKSIKLVDSNIIGFELSYDSITEEYDTIEAVIARIGELNNTETEYTVLWTKECVQATSGWLYCGDLPTSAKKITFVCEDERVGTSESRAFFRFELSNTDSVTYPIEFQGATAYALGAEYASVTASDCSTLHIGMGGRYDEVKIPATTQLDIEGKAAVDSLVYTGTSSSNSKMLYNAYSMGDEMVYPQLTLGSLTLGSATQKIDVVVHWASVEDSPVLTLNDLSAWENVGIYSYPTTEGYALKKLYTTDGKGVMAWVEQATPEVSLQYNDTKEIFTSIDEAMARIDSLNNANGDYVIAIEDTTYVKYEDNTWETTVSDFADVANYVFITNYTDTYIDLNLEDMDNTIPYSITFSDINIHTSDTLYTKDVAVMGSELSIIDGRLECDGVLQFTDAQFVDINNQVSADMLIWNPLGLKPDNEGISFYGAIYDEFGNTVLPNGQLNVGELVISTGEKLNLWNFIMGPSDMMNVDVYSEACDRVVMKYSMGAVAPLDFGMRENNDGSVTFYAKAQEPYYYVTDIYGNSFGNYREWADLLADFNKYGEKTMAYTIKIVDDKPIGLLPTKAARITLLGDPETVNPSIRTAGNTLSLTVPTDILNAELVYGAKDAKVNITTNGKALVLSNVSNIGKITGGNAIIDIDGRVEANIIQTVKELNVWHEATLYVNGVVSGITKLNLRGELQVEGSNAVTITNLEAWDNAHITYISNGAITQNITILGTVSGNNIDLERREKLTYESGEYELYEAEFAAGDKLLTASKALANQFVLDYGMDTYKTGTVIYAGKDGIELYNGAGDLVGTYSTWANAIKEINTNGNKEENYEILLTADFKLTTALTMPSKDRFASLKIDGKYAEHSLYWVGALTIPGRVEFGSKVFLNPILPNGTDTRCIVSLPNPQSVLVLGSGTDCFTNISGAKGSIIIKEGGSPYIRGNVTVKEIIMEGDNAGFYVTGALTAEKIYYQADFNDVMCYGNISITKAIVVDENATNPFFRIRDGKVISVKDIDLLAVDAFGENIKLNIKTHNVKTNDFVTLDPGDKVFTTTGDAYANQICLLDVNDNEMETYRTSNVIKVKGNVQTPYHVLLTIDESTEDLGCYATLNDVKSEINRRKAKTGTYTIMVEEAVFNNGVFPMPTAGTFKKMIFEGESITFTGALTLTGDTEFANDLIKVKSAADRTEVPLAINISKYKLTIRQGAEFENLGSISGTVGSTLEIMDNVYQEVSGNVTGITTLRLDGDFTVWGNLIVTNIVSNGAGVLNYDIDKNLTISGIVTFDEGTAEDEKDIQLYPHRSGSLMDEVPLNLNIIDSCTKADVADFVVAIDDTNVLYRSGVTVKLGVPMITVFEDIDEDWVNNEIGDAEQFVTINDAIVHVNEEKEGAFGIRLEGDIPSAGAIKTLTGADKIVKINGAGDSEYKLNFTGLFVVDRCDVEISNVKLMNTATVYASLNIKNGASVKLYNTTVNAITAPKGTAVTIVDAVTVKGTISGACDFTMEEYAVAVFMNPITVGNFTLIGETAEMRIMTGKGFTISGEVITDIYCCVTLNRIDKNNELAKITAGTAMVTAKNGKAGQFRTDNVMNAETGDEWLLTKSGNIIKTALLVAYVYEDSTPDEKEVFASFNEAKEYIIMCNKANDIDGEEVYDSENYVIELVADSTGADLRDLPDNLVEVVKGETGKDVNVKLTTTYNIDLNSDLTLRGVTLTATGKILNANSHSLLLEESSQITALKANELHSICISGGKATFTGRVNTINYTELYDGGSLACPVYTAFEPNFPY